MVKKKYCDFCKKKLPSIPFKCRHCGGLFCGKHRLPESHNCKEFTYSKTTYSQNRKVQDYKPVHSLRQKKTYQQKNKKKAKRKYLYFKIRNTVKSILYPFSLIIFLLLIVFLVEGLSYMGIIQEVDINATSHYIGDYKDGYRTYAVGGDGNRIYLQNNPNATDPTFLELVSFIKRDKTDTIRYSDNYVCADFAETLHNNAEANGLKAGYVCIDFFGDPNGHAMNAFNTTDKGLIYIDCTGTIKSFPCNKDKLIKIEIGKSIRVDELYPDNCYENYIGLCNFNMGIIENIEIYW